MGTLLTLFGIGLAIDLVCKYFSDRRKEARNDEFFDFSETTCNRCRTTVRAHSRVGAKAFYTCPKCGRSFTQHLYDPDR